MGGTANSQPETRPKARPILATYLLKIWRREFGLNPEALNGSDIKKPCLLLHINTQNQARLLLTFRAFCQLGKKV
jgi:hypothetical protein